MVVMGEKVYGEITLRFWVDAEVLGVPEDKALTMTREVIPEIVSDDFYDDDVTWRGVEVVKPAERSVFSEDTRLALLRAYEEWHAARTVLYHKENEGLPVDSGDWAGCDDGGIEMLHGVISKLVETDECGHKTADVAAQDDGSFLVTCEHCPSQWSVKDGVGTTV